MLEKYYRVNQAAGVNIHILQNGDLQINACEVTVENNSLTFGKKLTGLTAITDLKSIPVKSFIALNLSGRGILQKQVEQTAEINQQNFGKVLPNGNIDDFYIQNFISGEYSFVSLVRKTEVDKWIAQIKEVGFIPLTLSLGPFTVQQILPQLNSYDEQLNFNGHVITFNEKSDWVTYQYIETTVSQFPIKVESEIIDEKLLIPYAVGFQLILEDKVGLIHADVPVLDEEFSKLLAKKKLQVKGALILFVFFVLLLINFILFSWLNTSNAELATQVSRTAKSSVDLKTIDEKVKQKEALLRELGWEGGVNKSTLVDQLASLLPEEITWTDVLVDPIDQASSRIQKTLTFYSRQIKITGTSDKIIPVNEWIARVKTKLWVKNIQMDSYTFNSELNTGQFTVSINY